MEQGWLISKTSQGLPDGKVKLYLFTLDEVKEDTAIISLTAQ